MRCASARKFSEWECFATDKANCENESASVEPMLRACPPKSCLCRMLSHI